MKEGGDKSNLESQYNYDSQTNQIGHSRNHSTVELIDSKNAKVDKLNQVSP